MPDFDQIDSIFRLVNREVWIVTAANGERRGGLVATWVSQASMDTESPTVLAGIAPNHFTAELIDASGSFAVHLISMQHIEAAWSFAIGSGRMRDKFEHIAAASGETGSPILRDCLAWLECRVFARLDAGDRIYYWADVVASGMPGSGLPLCEHELIAATNEEQRRHLIEDRQSDILLQRPQREAWRRDMPELLRPR